MNSLGKLDYRLNDHHELNGSYFYGRYTALSVPYGFPATQSFWEDLQGVQTQLGRVVEVWTPNSNWVNEARVGVDHDYRPVARNECTPPGAVWNSASGNGLNTGFAAGPNYATQYGLVSGSIGCGIPSITVSGFTGQVGYSQNRVQFDTDTQGADTVSYTRGKHQFKFGTDVRAEHYIGAKVLDQQTGIIGFGATGAAVFSGATALEDFLAGVPSSEAIRAGSPIRNITTDKIALFAQDDWRIAPRVILNLGLRWEDETPARDSHGLLGNFDPNVLPSGMVQTNQMWKNQSDWGPRLGFAWDITGKGTTVIRGGGGIQYMIPQLIQFVAGGNGGVTGEDYGGEPTGAILYRADGTTIAPVGTITSGIISQVPITGSNGVVTNGLPWTAGQAIFSGGTPKCGNGIKSTANPAVINPPTCIGTGGDPNIFTGYRFYSWNLNVQHAFTNNLSLDVGYVGTHSADIPEFYVL
jgi:TonB dependent receptor